MQEGGLYWLQAKKATTQSSLRRRASFFNGTFVRAHRYWELELKLYCLGSGAGPQPQSPAEIWIFNIGLKSGLCSLVCCKADATRLRKGKARNKAFALIRRERRGETFSHANYSADALAPRASKSKFLRQRSQVM